MQPYKSTSIGLFSSLKERRTRTNLTTRLCKGSLGIALAAGFATPLWAESFTPHVEGEVEVEIAENHVRQGDTKQNDANPEIDMEAHWLFTPAFSLHGGFTLESGYEGDKNFYFKHHSLSTGELYLEYEIGNFHLFVGKLNPTFGTAWDITPGVYGTSLAEDYETGEGYLAASAALTLNGGKTGQHTLTGTAYRLDRSLLARTAFTSNNGVSLADGGLTNTKDLESFSLTLDSENILGYEGWNTHMGYRKQATAEIDKNDPTKADEDGLVFGLNGTYKLFPHLQLDMMAELAYFTNFEGEKGVDAHYATVGGTFLWNSYNLALAHTQKEVDNLVSSLSSVSIGTEFQNKWALDVGYALGQEEDQEDTHSVGFTLSKAIAFNSQP